jgi:hypothetical protein
MTLGTYWPRSRGQSFSGEPGAGGFLLFFTRTDSEKKMTDSIFVGQEFHTEAAALDFPRLDRQLQAMALLELITLGRREFAAGRFGDADAFMAEMDSST